MIGKPNTLRPSQKMTIPQPLLALTTSKPLGSLIFWRRAKPTTITKSETLFIQELKPAFNVNIESEKLMLY